eukprot:265600-Prymnesium_polylepis.2
MGVQLELSERQELVPVSIPLEVSVEQEFESLNAGLLRHSRLRCRGVLGRGGVRRSGMWHAEGC